MRTLIVVMAMATSVNGFALESTFIPTYAISASSSMAHKEATQIMNDVNEFRASGNASVLLEESINNLQAVNDISVEEALDVLEAQADSILN